MSKTYHPEILNQTRLDFFKQLGFTKSLGLYLAGGTSLALQIGHRQSIDFDFYTDKHFKKGILNKTFSEQLASWRFNLLRDIDDTFEANIAPDIHLSCFYYKYPLLKKPRLISGVLVVSLKDIAAMKLVAISQRGTRRDFIDMYYLLQYFNLKEVLRLTQEKFPEFDIYNGLRGLLYFYDADNDPALERSMVFDKQLSWTKVKKNLVSKVKDFQKSVGK
jgi:hypothetical protein